MERVTPAKTPDPRRDALERVLAAPEFAAAGRLSQLLRHLAEHALTGDGTALKETVLGVEVFGREPGYDPKTDSVVRSEVRRLRLKLGEYYANSGRPGEWRIEIPKGAYRVVFLPNEPMEVRPPSRRRPVLVAAATALGLAAVGWYGWWSSQRSGDPVTAEPRQLTNSLGQALHPNLSRDGRWLVYSYAHEDQSGIYAAQFDRPRFEPERLVGTRARDYNPVIDAQGRRVAFLRQEDAGGFSVMVQERGASEARRWFHVDRRDRMAWLPDGRLIVSTRVAGGATALLLRISEAGERTPLFTPPPGTLYDGMPALSPDGRQIAFTRAADASLEEIWLAPVGVDGLPTGEPRRLTNDRRKFNGFCYSADGRALIASTRAEGALRGLWRIPLDDPGRRTRIAGSVLRAAYPTLAPATGQLVYSVALDDLNLYRADGGAISPSLALDSSPSLSPDGSQVAFRSERSSASEIWVARLDGKEARPLTAINGAVTGSPRWSPDGQWIAYDTRRNGNADIYLVSPDGRRTRQVTTGPANEMVPTWSRDSRRIYYASDAGGSLEIWSRALDASGEPARQVTLGGGFRALESPDGRWLYYAKRKPKSGLWRMPLGGGPEEAVLPLDDSGWGSWSLSSQGLFLTEAGPRPRIVRRPFETAEPVVEIARITKLPVLWDGSLDVSADGRVTVFAQLDQAVGDLFLLAPAPAPAR